MKPFKNLKDWKDQFDQNQSVQRRIGMIHALYRGDEFQKELDFNRDRQAIVTTLIQCSESVEHDGRITSKIVEVMIEFLPLKIDKTLAQIFQFLTELITEHKLYWFHNETVERKIKNYFKRCVRKWHIPEPKSISKSLTRDLVYALHAYNELYLLRNDYTSDRGELYNPVWCLGNADVIAALTEIVQKGVDDARKNNSGISPKPEYPLSKLVSGYFKHNGIPAMDLVIHLSMAKRFDNLMTF